jgi:hypothetical protein
LFVLLAVADGAWTSISLAKSLHTARDELQLGANELMAGNVDAAAEHFAVARREAMTAKRFVGHPVVSVGALLPFVGDDVRAVRAVARASVFAAEAGAGVTRAAKAAGWTPAGLPGLEQAGHIDLALVRSAAPALRAASHATQEARAAISGIDSDGLLGPIRRPFVAARATLDEQATSVASAASMAGLLPSFLGAQGPRDYLVAFQNLSDARGSGGFMGSYGILHAQDGTMSMGAIGSLSDLKRAPPIKGLPDVQRRYADFGGTTRFNAANYSPNFPTAARVLLQLWRNDGRGTLDGVLAVDPVWMAYVSSVIGPITAPTWPVPLTADNIATVLSHDTFLTSDQTVSNTQQAELGAAVLQGLLGRPIPSRGFGAVMARSVQERHFQVFSAHPREEHLLGELGATGRLDLGRNPLFVVRNDALDNRSGWFAHASVGYDIKLDANGTADVSMTYSLRNEAPRHGPPSLLIGFLPNQPQGIFATDVNMYLPRDVRKVTTKVIGSPTVTIRQEEFGHPVIDRFMQLKGHSTAEVRLHYEVPHAAAVDDHGAFRYAARLIPQPALWPVPVQVRITLPDGSSLDQVGGGLVQDASGVVYTSDAMTDRTLVVSYRA